MLTDLKLIAVVLGIAGVTTLLLFIGEACPFLRGRVVLADDSGSHAHGGEDHVQVTEHAGEHETHEETEPLGQHPDHSGFTNVRSVVQLGQTDIYITIILIASSPIRLLQLINLLYITCMLYAHCQWLIQKNIIILLGSLET